MKMVVYYLEMKSYVKPGENKRKNALCGGLLIKKENNCGENDALLQNKNPSNDKTIL